MGTTLISRRTLGQLPGIAGFVVAGLAVGACGSGGYCQSGPYHGTQCYSQTEATGWGTPSLPNPSILTPNEIHPPTPTRYHTTPTVPDGGISWSQ